MYLLFLHLLICYIRSIAKASWRFYDFSALELVCLRDEAANLCHSFTWQFATLFFRTLAACHGFFEANRVLVFLYNGAYSNLLITTSFFRFSLIPYALALVTFTWVREHLTAYCVRHGFAGTSQLTFVTFSLRQISVLFFVLHHYAYSQFVDTYVTISSRRGNLI